MLLCFEDNFVTKRAQNLQRARPQEYKNFKPGSALVCVILSCSTTSANSYFDITTLSCFKLSSNLGVLSHMLSLAEKVRMIAFQGVHPVRDFKVMVTDARECLAKPR